MGAALLKKPDTIVDIISTLSRNLSIPVSLKIRLLENEADSVELLRRVEHAGASAVAIHRCLFAQSVLALTSCSRYVHERPRQKAHWDILGNVIRSSTIAIPIIANGDVYSQDDIASLKEISGADSVMIARGAIADPSIFAPRGRAVPRGVAVCNLFAHLFLC